MILRFYEIKILNCKRKVKLTKMEERGLAAEGCLVFGLGNCDSWVLGEEGRWRKKGVRRRWM